jgi:hypothetical protein
MQYLYTNYTSSSFHSMHTITTVVSFSSCLCYLHKKTRLYSNLPVHLKKQPCYTLFISSHFPRNNYTLFDGFIPQSDFCSFKGHMITMNGQVFKVNSYLPLGRGIVYVTISSFFFDWFIFNFFIVSLFFKIYTLSPVLFSFQTNSALCSVVF